MTEKKCKKLDEKLSKQIATELAALKEPEGHEATSALCIGITTSPVASP